MRNYSVRADNSREKLGALYVPLVFIPFCSMLYSWVPALHSFVYICAISVFLSLFVVPKFFLSRQFWLAIAYMAVVFINANNGDEFAYKIRLMDGFIMLMSACIGYYIVTHQDSIKIWIVIVVFLTMIIQTIPSLAISRAAPGGLRELINLQYLDQTDFSWDYLYRAGLLSYETIHAIPFFIPPVIMWLRTKKLKAIWKVFLWIVLLFFILLVFLYEATTIELLVILNIAASLFVHRTDKIKSRKRIIVLAMIFLPVVISYQLQVTALETIESVASGELSHKAGDAARDLQGIGGSDASVRIDKYSLSLQEFIKSPLIGTNDSNGIGGHSVIFDRLASLGFVGVLLYLLFVFAMLRYCNSFLPSNVNKWYYYISAFSFLIVLLLKNMHKIEIWLGMAVVVPALLTISEYRMTK